MSLVACDREDSVTIAYIHGDNGDRVSHSWHMSLIEMIGHDLRSKQRIISGGWLAIRCGTDGLSEARNKAIEQFLSEERGDWLFWIDTDMGFGPDTIEQLLAMADPDERPIVGGLCFSWKELSPDGIGGYRCAPRPVMLDWRTIGEESGFMGRQSYPVNSLVQCGGTGSACLLVHRSALVRIRDAVGAHWYDRIPNPTTGGNLIGEDLSFCMRAGAAGIPVYVHTGVRTSHHKSAWVSEPDYWGMAVAAPATARTAVLVPVMKRPQNAQPFMESLRASTGLATVYAIADDDDRETAYAWAQAGAQVFHFADDSGPGTFAEKVNIGYRRTDEPWMLLVGDDVRFHPGWLDHAQFVGNEQGGRIHVVGTLDLGNPRVMSGEHSTHLLVRRSYIDEQGGGWDGPKILAHEGYGHWFVDDEIVTVAKQRDVWGMALGAVIEHLHPYWGKGMMDEVYALGESRSEADRKLFMERLEANS